MNAPTQIPSTSAHSAEDNSSARNAEAALIARCREGDLSSFDCLVEQYQDRIFNLCYWMLGNRDEAADAAQDAFVRAFRSLASFRGDSSFGTWLHRIAVNVAIDAKHRRKRTPVPYSDLQPAGDQSERGDIETLGNQSTLIGQPASADGQMPKEPSRIALVHERRAAVRAALARLPEHYRFVLVLFDIEGHSYEEISQSLHLPLGTVKSRINRARAQLRLELQGARELFDD